MIGFAAGAGGERVKLYLTDWIGRLSNAMAGRNLHHVQRAFDAAATSEKKKPRRKPGFFHLSKWAGRCLLLPIVSFVVVAKVIYHKDTL
jgi:hypothetical protein